MIAATTGRAARRRANEASARRWTSWASPRPIYARRRGAWISRCGTNPPWHAFSSRFPYGTAITPEKLTQVNRCERVLRELGFRVYRVRYHDELARIEVAPDEFDKLLQPGIREEILRRFKDAGFTYVSIDLQGYRTGSLNESVKRQ